MVNEKRLIDAKLAQHIADVELTPDEAGVVQWVLSHTPTVDAVPVESILLHHILIDENGIPEVKLQLGDRTLILRREGDPVDAVKAVHAEWLDLRFDFRRRSMLATCSHCKVRGEVRMKSNECGFVVPDSDYCPNCGAKMDGGTI